MKGESFLFRFRSAVLVQGGNHAGPFQSTGYMQNGLSSFTVGCPFFIFLIREGLSFLRCRVEKSVDLKQFGAAAVRP